MTNVGVAIIGGGMAGLLMAVNLQQRGIPFTIYEKAESFGGTWRDNRYPGLVCDVPVSLYQFDFAPKHDWTRPFSPGPEINAYLNDVAAQFGLSEHTRFGVEIATAVWGDEGWTLTTRDDELIRAQVVILATGFLREIVVPNLPGRDSFRGDQFHSAQWPEHYDVEGKRIAVVGSGASGIQLLSEFAFQGLEVTQFIRRPQWVETIKNPTASEQWRRIVRDSENGSQLLADFEAQIDQDPRLRDPYWKIVPGPAREAAQQALRDDLAAVRDPELRAALTPDYPPGCTRVPKSDRFYEAVQLPNARIVRGAVTAVDETGLIDSHGEHHQFDVIVWATGFNTHAYMRPMEIIGADGTDLSDLWDSGPFSYRGVAVPGFPNLYICNGPFSPVNNVPVPITLKHEAMYAMPLIERAINENVAFDPTPQATDAFLELMREWIPKTVWAEGCTSWYQDASGLPVIWPWYAQEHERMLGDPAPDDLTVRQLAGARSG